MDGAGFGVPHVSQRGISVYPSDLKHRAKMVLLAPDPALGPPQTLPSMIAYICKEGELQPNPNPVITLSLTSVLDLVVNKLHR